MRIDATNGSFGNNTNCSAHPNVYHGLSTINVTSERKRRRRNESSATSNLRAHFSRRQRATAYELSRRSKNRTTQNHRRRCEIDSNASFSSPLPINKHARSNNFVTHLKDNYTAGSLGTTLSNDNGAMPDALVGGVSTNKNSDRANARLYHLSSSCRRGTFHYC
jgi:hypothetical protein